MSNRGFIFPVLIYFGNIFFTTVTHFFLYIYLLGKGSSICKPVTKQEKKILLELSFFPIIIISLIFTTLILSLTLFKDSGGQSLLIYLPTAAIAFLIRRRLRKSHAQIKKEIIHFQSSHEQG